MVYYFFDKKSPDGAVTGALWDNLTTQDKNIPSQNKITFNDKCITTNDFNKFSGVVSDERLKQAKLGKYSDLFDVEKLENKQWRKKRKWQTFDFNLFISKRYSKNDESQCF